MNVYRMLQFLKPPVLVFGLLAAAGAMAQDVQVTSADPSSAEQGTVNLDVTISGQGFDNSAQVRFLVTGTENPGGITVNSTKVRGSKKIIANIDVAVDAIVDDFDIEVEMLGGRKGKGTTLFAVFKPSLPDQIYGCMTLDATKPIRGQAGNPVYCHGDPVSHWQSGVPTEMWMYLDCKLNFVTFHPRGVERYYQVDLPVAVDTAISSCDLDGDGQINDLDDFVDFQDTASAAARDCANSDPDWGFGHFMRNDQRTEHDRANVCGLMAGESQSGDLQLQILLHHLTECRGGKNKCGEKQENMTIWYDDEGDCDEASPGHTVSPVTIACEADNGLSCIEWSVESTGDGCFIGETHGAEAFYLPFRATFVPFAE